MKLKLFKKYFLLMFAVVCASVFAIFMILSVTLNNYIVRSNYKTLSDACQRIADSIQNSEFDTAKQDFLQIAGSLSTVLESDMFISNLDGEIVACVCKEWKEQEKCVHSSYIVPKDVIQNAIDAKGPNIQSMDMYHVPHFISARQIDLDGDYYVFATSPTTKAEKLISAVTKLIIMSSIAPILLMLLLFFIITYRLTRPIKSMSEAAKAMAKGDFSKRIPVTSDDEIGELAISFNNMTNSLARLESMRRGFIGSVSHELRTPMTTISGFIDGILDGTIPPEKHDYYLNIVSYEVKRLSRLVNSMLDISKLESGEVKLNMKTFNMSELVCSVVVGHERRIEERQLEIEGLDTLSHISICADKDLIHQVIYNLTENAIKFTNDSGKISFELTDDPNSVIFKITNTGQGIPEKELPFVFERFYKCDKSRSDSKNSLGIGLYLVKTIVLAHKGQVSVSSREGQFTTFKVVLPKGEI